MDICCVDLAVSKKEFEEITCNYSLDKHWWEVFAKKDRESTCDKFEYKKSVLKTIAREEYNYINSPETINWEEDYANI
jgi:hypothetical protein